MQYIDPAHEARLLNKYHDTALPFDTMSRFTRNDSLFDPDTGMDADAICDGIRKQDQTLAAEGTSHPIRKALAFAYVLEHTRIGCDDWDRYPLINCVDRPLNKTIIADWKREVFTETIPEVEARRAELERTGTVTIWPDFDHSIPVWKRVFSLGIPGLLRESNEAEAVKAAASPLTPEERDFYGSIRITLGAFIRFMGRLEVLAEKRSDGGRMARALARLQVGAPTTFYEALLLDYIYFMLSEHIEGLQVRSLCQFDAMLYPFYRHDLDAGTPEETLREDLAYFLIQFTAIDNYWNQPLYLGGTRADGTTEINELSYVFMDVYDRMGLYNPKIQLKIGENTPSDFIRVALDMIRRGHSSIVFVSDALMQKALIRDGVPAEEARICDVRGCYEYSPVGSMDTGMNYINLLKPLEYAMRQGRDGISGVLAGLPSPAEYEDFDAFYREYKAQLIHIIDETVEVVNGFEGYLAQINPQPLLSSTYPSCLASGKDALLGGGCTNNSIMLFGFMANLCDSLTVIKRLVFEKKEMTLSELTQILDRNFEGHELLRRRILASREKYGNNKALPDAFAADIAAFVAEYVRTLPNAEKRGGHWNCGFHVSRQSYDQAKTTAASPDGRLLGQELSKNISASMGQCREGVTAAVLSATKIDASAFTCDACVDLAFLPSAVRGEDGLDAMEQLLHTFIARGGHACHFNVFQGDTLRDAQKHPERYMDLQIRVCGWNVLFRNINKEEQDGFIAQAEALA